MLRKQPSEMSHQLKGAKLQQYHYVKQINFKFDGTREGANRVKEELRRGSKHLPPPDAQVDGGLHGVRDAESDPVEAQF